MDNVLIEKWQKAAWFYFRDPYYAETLPLEERKFYISEGPEESERLHKLKGKSEEEREKREQRKFEFSTLFYLFCN